MKLTGSRTYYTPSPPKMPPGLVEVIEELTKEVLRRNPKDVYGFCASYMEQLLEKRDGPLNKKSVSLEEKIARAQEKIRQREREKSRQEFDKNVQQEQIGHSTNKETVDDLILRDRQLTTAVVFNELSSDSNKDHLNASPQECDTKNMKALTPVQKVTSTQAFHSDIYAQEDNHEVVTIRQTETNSKEVMKEDCYSTDESKIAQPFCSTSVSEILNKHVDIFKSTEHTDNLALSSPSILIPVEPPIEDVTDHSLTNDNEINQEQAVSPVVTKQNLTPNDTNAEVTQGAKVDTIGNEFNDNLIVLDASDGSNNVIHVVNMATAVINSNNGGQNVNDVIQIEYEKLHTDNTDDGMEMSSTKQIANNVQLTTLNIKESNLSAQKVNVDDTCDLRTELVSAQNSPYIDSLYSKDKADGTNSFPNAHIEDIHLLDNNAKLDSENNTYVIQQENLPDIELSRDSLQTKQIDDVQSSNVPRIDISNDGSTFSNIEKHIKDLRLDDTTNYNDMESKISINSTIPESNINFDLITVGAENKKKTLNDGQGADDSIRTTSEDKISIANTYTGDKDNTYFDEIISDTTELQNSIQRNNKDNYSPLHANFSSVPIHSLEMRDNYDRSLEVSSMKANNQDDNLNNTKMDLEKAAITIQKVFRSFIFKSRGSTFEDIANDDAIFLDDDAKNKEECDFPIALNVDRRTHGINRSDTVLQTVNEEKSLSLSTDDSCTLSSAATIIQAHVRGFLVRNRLNSNKKTSTNSLPACNSNEPSVETENDENMGKTVLNIHIVPEVEDSLSRDESLITSIDLSLDSPTSTLNLHPLSNDKSERRKRLKREDAVQSISPPSNNSGKLSVDLDSVKESLVIDNVIVVNHLASNSDRIKGTLDGHDVLTGNGLDKTGKANNEVVVDIIENNIDDLQTQKQKNSLTEMNIDERDVVTPFTPQDDNGLLHSGEFHDAILPTKVSPSDTSVVRGE